MGIGEMGWIIFVIIGIIAAIIIGVVIYISTSSSVSVIDEISVIERPFAINPDNGIQRILGIFDSEAGNQLIGLYVENKGASSHSNVKITMSPLPSSNIVMIDNSATINDLSPNIPTLVVLKGDFSNVQPDKYDVDIIFESDQQSAVHKTAKIFTAKTTLTQSNPDFGSRPTFTTEFPEGKMTIDIQEFYHGPNWRSQWAPTVETMVLEYNEPCEEQMCTVPYADWVWKAAGLVGKGLSAFASGYYLAEGIDTGDGIKTAAAGGGALMLISEAATFADEEDPIVRGQQNTVPNQGEKTIKEIVTMNADYLEEPLPGKEFTVNTSWTYTRITIDDNSNLNQYNYSITDELVKNQHWAIGYTINTDKNSYGFGEELIVTASITGKDGNLLQNKQAYVVATLQSEPSQGEFIIMTDDGQGKDNTANDGIYTGTTILDGTWTPGDWKLTLFAHENLFGFNEFGGMVINDFPTGWADKIYHLSINVN